MSDKVTERPLRKAWLVAIVAAAIGGVAAGVFAAVWFRYTAGNCGVVRFYEQAFGVIVLGAWGLGTGAGALLVLVGRRRGIVTAAAGSGLVVLASVIMVLVCVKTIRDIRAADYSLKSTDQLLGWLTGDDLDARKLAAHALGERRAPEAVPGLCVILEDIQSDINLRHNAALALGKICAPPRPQGIDLDRAVASLAGALETRDEYLPCSIAEALGRIGDVQAVSALATVLADASRPSLVREDVARALGRIGGHEARTALEKARDAGGDDQLRQRIDAVLRTMEDPQR